MVHHLLGLPPSEQMSWLTKRGQGQLNALQAAAWDEAAPTLMARGFSCTLSRAMSSPGQQVASHDLTKRADTPTLYPATNVPRELLNPRLYSGM